MYCVWIPYINLYPCYIPVGTDGGVVSDLVVVDSRLALLNEADLLTIGPDTGGPSDGLLEMGVDGGPSYGLQPLQLPRCSHIEPLRVCVCVCVLCVCVCECSVKMS